MPYLISRLVRFTFTGLVVWAGMVACADTTAAPRQVHGHGCADKVAYAFTYEVPVKGVWNCLGQEMRDKYTTAGRSANDSVLVPPEPDPSFSVQSLKYGGHAGDMEFYYVAVSEGESSKEIALIMFVTKDGRVDNYAFDSPEIG